MSGYEGDHVTAVNIVAAGCTDTAVLYGRCDPGSAVSTRGPKAGQRAAAGCDAARTQPRRRCGVDFRTAAAAGSRQQQSKPTCTTR